MGEAKLRHRTVSFSLETMAIPLLSNSHPNRTNRHSPFASIIMHVIASLDNTV